MSDDKLEFASPAWVDEVRAYLEKAVAELGDAMAGVRFSHCEVFTDPPPHLADESNRVAWWLSVDGNKVEVGSGVRDDIRSTVTVDYAYAIPFAKEILDPAPREPDAEGEGDAKPGLPREVMAALVGMHNHLAARTR